MPFHPDLSWKLHVKKKQGNSFWSEQQLNSSISYKKQTLQRKKELFHKYGENGHTFDNDDEREEKKDYCLVEISLKSHYF